MWAGAAARNPEPFKPPGSMATFMMATAFAACDTHTARARTEALTP